MNVQAFATVGIYAALNTIILMWLTTATGQLRRRYKVLIGDGGVPHMIRILRGHANAIENIPMMMVLLIIAAALGTPVYVLHLLGIVFTVGRAIHALHFIQEHGASWQRMAGFGLSFLALLLATLGVLGHALTLVF